MKEARDVHEELRARLREAGEAHEPDRARILARIEREMAGEARPERPAHPSPAGWARVVGATTAVAGLLAVGGYAVTSAVQGEEPADRTVAVSPTPAPSPEVTSRPPVKPDPTPSAEKPDRKPSSTPSRTPAPENSAPAPPPEKPEKPDNEDGPVWSDGSVDPHSNDFWAQSNLTLRTTEELTALTVELRVALTDGVNSAGAWRSLPEEDFTLTVGEDDGFLAYRWVLKEGRTVPQGEFVFAGQYDHARGGRDARDDRYAMTATAGGEQYAVGGGFARGGDENTDEGDP